MNIKVLRRLAHALRALLLLMTLLGMATMFVFSHDRFWSSLNSLHNWIVDRYTNLYHNRLEAALGALKKDRHDGIQLLEALLKDLEPIGKGDRLAGLKREVMYTLALQDGSRPDRSLAWFDRWIAFDDRDLVAQVNRAQLLLRMPARAKEGEQVLTALYRKVPEVAVVAKSYQAMLLEQGRLAEAVLFSWNQCRYAFLEWEVYWGEGGGFNEKQRRIIIPSLSENLEFEVTVPGHAVQMRIDPPPNLALEIIEPTVRVGQDTSFTTLNLLEIPLSLNQIQHRRNRLITSGEHDPYFFWTLPPGTRNAGQVTVLFQARIRPSFSDVLRRLNSVAEARTLEHKVAEHEPLAAREFHAAWVGEIPGGGRAP